MITFPLLGRMGKLGNQLFQIASMIGIAEANKQQLSLPKWNYSKYFKASLPEGICKGQKIPEKHYHFDQSLLHLGTGNYEINGWLQSEKYWQHCKEKVLRQFEFNAETKLAVSKYTTTNTVAISVRRGDFVNNPNYFQIPITYYINAYYKHFEGMNIIVFSDDIKYCKKHLHLLPNVRFADNLSDIEQLCLMSQCEAHIISNSTFSWWGAYLSQSAKVIRPERNIDGPLAKDNDEKDYWLPTWQIFKDYRIDLKDTTFIIPVFHDHNDRKQNLKLTVCFLQEYFKTNIIVGEQGTDEFKWCIDARCEYIKFDYRKFHRTRMINEMAKQAQTPIIVNWDCDTVISPLQLLNAVEQIRSGVDICYPFDGTVQRVPRYLFNDIAQSLDPWVIDVSKFDTKQSSVGHAVVMNKESFIKAGMENENFISWGPEDSERFNRYNILGLTVKRTEGAIFHMDHHVGENSSPNNPHYKENDKEFMRVVTKQRNELENYISQWEWLS